MLKIVRIIIALILVFQYKRLMRQHKKKIEAEKRKERYNAIFYTDHWTKEFASPMEKWMFNLFLAGLYLFPKNRNLQLLWGLFFNPAIVILYVSIFFSTLIFFSLKNH